MTDPRIEAAVRVALDYFGTRVDVDPYSLMTVALAAADAVDPVRQAAELAVAAYDSILPGVQVDAAILALRAALGGTA